MKKPPLGEKDVLNPEEAITYFGFSRRKFYRFLNEGKCKKITALYGRVHFFAFPIPKYINLC